MADARTERWVAHRAEVRERLIDSAIRTIDQIGPQVTMQELATEAKIQKPTLYRFFTDKAELVRGIHERMRGEWRERIVTVPTDPDVTIGDFIRSCIDAYLQSVHEHPHVHRLMVQMMVCATGSEVKKDDPSPSIADDMAAMMHTVISALGGTRTDLELDAHMLMGSVMYGVIWWLDSDMTTEYAHLLDHIDKNLRAMLQATAHANRIHVDFDAPMAVILSTLSVAES
ncbi:putative transcriptional regulator, TetR family [Nocardia nova SH22a]|uniref:Putative transcriptional regulator, TetR family n=1 Tax=Nocardia nova SH22a TaxID=1415166 RepID=W5TGJ6_9NOCA|nr:TetR/AcrR family transcriptional regulator [Nocardia nova]AHH18465.1 putative transcriptional regulator, TetR family [Nocardia nova SH22a]